MKARFFVAALAAVALYAFACVPARAQYANEFTMAKLIKQGTTTHAIAGSGTVVVQVQVNADGSHKAIKVLRSTNSGDNAAAMDIAQTSTYRPAHRGTKPVVSFYDFTLKFNGKSVAAATEEGGGVPAGSVSTAASQVAALIRQGQFKEAVSKAQSGLLASPGDESLREMLGIAEYRAGDLPAAAAAFDKVTTIGPQFRPIAADSFATAAVKAADDNNATQALAYAQKAMALSPSTNARFALGVAQLANKDYAAAIASLRSARDAIVADPKVPVSSKVNVDSRLLQAYIANHDTADAQAVAAQIKQLDPKSQAGSRAMGNTLLQAGQAAMQAKDTATALKDFDQAAALGDPQVAVTANVEAALTVGNSAKPDWKQVQAYAEKALAINPNDAGANYAEGVALTRQWQDGHGRDDALKKRAADALNKADQQAKSQGDESLALQIESFIKNNLNAPGSQSGGGS
jgi:TonB family protein